MPRGDRTGPMGMGPMTGRGAGYCAGYAVPGYANPIGFAGGFGCGFGRGRGFRRMYYATGFPGWARYGYPAHPRANEGAADEKEFLNNQVDFLEGQLREIKKRLANLKEDNE
ncbi:MAG: DUF5320 domain-containing protein [Clostridiales bacterium]|nr:DUF5320 domain-containing protein [Clostridiales bacterium]